MIDRLRSSGWISYTFDGDDLGAHLISVATQLGFPVAARRRKSPLEVLTPVAREKAKPSSPSRMFGLGALPLHTDTAHWIEPCRYIVLGCVSPGLCGRRTVLADSSLLNFSTGARRLLQDSQFRVVNGRKSFFAPVIGPNYTFFRFDKACMVPIDARSRAALEAMDRAISDLQFEQVDWIKGQVLVMDNWRILHGRTNPVGSGGGRVLERVLVQ